MQGHNFLYSNPHLQNLAVEKLAPITTEMQKITTDPKYIDEVLTEGAERALAIAGPIIEKTKDILGLKFKSD